MDVTMPTWGEAMDEGTLLEWSVSIGDIVSRGDAIGVIQTDKVDAELEAPADGVVVELLVEEGASVPVGTPVARLEAR
ncbi:MAG: lipoyl domain-containing protein [Solirubrobacterales bacterium]